MVLLIASKAPYEKPAMVIEVSEMGILESMGYS